MQVPALLELTSVAARRGRITALWEVSLIVAPAEIVALLGRNGAGKSTTLRAISGLVRPHQGVVCFAGEDITGLAPRAIARRGIAHVPEGRRLFPGLTARENILIGLSARQGRRSDARADYAAILALFPEIEGFADAVAWTLSGGQQQMVALARGLIARPRLLLLDEPSLGLAPRIVQRIAGALRAIRASGTAVLLVEQNARMALAIADRGYVLESGRIVLAGDAASLAADPAVQAAYLGAQATG
jgi:branched-chain amino acid transport system ATP-binding protein